MSWEKFESEVKSLLQRDFKITELKPETSLEVMDSLAVTEVLTLAEQELNIEMSFEEVRKLKDFASLKELVIVRGVVL